MVGAMTTSPAQGDSPVATTTDQPAHADVFGMHTAECGGVKCGGPHCSPPTDWPGSVLHAVHLDVDMRGDEIGRAHV